MGLVSRWQRDLSLMDKGFNAALPAMGLVYAAVSVEAAAITASFNAALPAMGLVCDCMYYELKGL